MKLHNERSVVERSGVQTEASFKIKTTSKAFDILSSGLYTDPIMAIIRELSCNAYDAHVDANKSDVPFELHLPNGLEPFLSIKDFGTGLSEDQVYNLYTTYFESTKTDSNDFIGALGLGSKSPFSYTNAFEVISRYNGKQSLYSVFLNEDGIPSIARLGQFKTNESNGLEVKISVKTSDFNAFATKAKNVLRFFPVKPKVTGHPSFEFEKLSGKILESKDGRWFIDSKGHYLSGFTAVQGNVPYRVELDTFRNDIPENDLTFCSRFKITAFFDIGDLEVAASREEIRYDERSKQNIMKMLSRIRREFVQTIDDHVTKNFSKNKWEAFCQLRKYTKDFCDLLTFCSIVSGSTVKNQLLKEFVQNEGVLFVTTPMYHEIVFYGGAKYNDRFTRRVTVSPKQPDNTSSATWKRVIPLHNTAIVFNDVSSGGVKRTYDWACKSNYHDTIMIKIAPSLRGNKGKAERLANKGKIQSDFNKILKELGNPNYVTISEDMPVTKRTTKPLPVYVAAGRKWCSSEIKWERDYDDVDFEDGGVYLLVRRGSTVCGEYSKDCDNALKDFNYYDLVSLTNIINKHNKTKYQIHSDVIGVGVSTWNAIQKLPPQLRKRWTPFFKLVDQCIPNYYSLLQSYWVTEQTTSVHDMRHLHVTSLLQYNGSSTNKRKLWYQEITKQVSTLKSTSLFRKVAEPLMQANDVLSTSVDDVKALDRYISMKQQKSSLQRKLGVPLNIQDTKKLGTVYPMLKYVEQAGYLFEDLDEIFNYIKLVDKTRR